MGSSTHELYLHYNLKQRVAWAVAAVIVGVLIAGFWNYKAVDGFGRELIAGQIIGNTTELASNFGDRGYGFGFLFAAVAGLAATLTACNCVTFAMLPGLVCSTDKKAARVAAWRAFGMFTVGLLAVCAVYGFYIGTLDPAQIKEYNSRTVRLTQAQITFTGIGVLMLVWGVASAGLLNFITNKIPFIMQRLSAPMTKAGLLGIFAGLFSVGRPFPVFRDFLLYASSSQNPWYGTLAMSVQGIGQIAVMVALFVVIVMLFGRKLFGWAAEKPHQASFVSAMTMLIGGAFFVYYWGIAMAFNLGSWGFKLGWYH